MKDPRSFKWGWGRASVFSSGDKVCGGKQIAKISCLKSKGNKMSHGGCPPDSVIAAVNTRFFQSPFEGHVNLLCDLHVPDTMT